MQDLLYQNWMLHHPFRRVVEVPRYEYNAVTCKHPATGFLLQFVPVPLIKLYLSNKPTGALY
jgi:hypothetical protein